MTKVEKREVYAHIGDALQGALPEDGTAEVGMDYHKLYLRMGGQVFIISVDEKQQFAKADDPVEAAQNFMATLPFWPWNRDAMA